MATHPRSAASSDSCLAANFFNAAEYCSSTRRRSCVLWSAFRMARLGIGCGHLEPVGNVRVELFRMLQSVIEHFDSLNGLEAGLKVFPVSQRLWVKPAQISRTSIWGYSWRWRSIARVGGGRLGVEVTLICTHETQPAQSCRRRRCERVGMRMASSDFPPSMQLRSVRRPPRATCAAAVLRIRLNQSFFHDPIAYRNLNI